MYKKSYVIVAVVLAFTIGYSVNNIAVSDTTPKIAVVDTAKIISNSSSAKSIKEVQQRKMQEMRSTLEKARQEISKETDSAKAAKLEEKYREDINKQKLALDTEYNRQISSLEKEIKSTISEKAKNMNYAIVLPKDIVFFGGDDITDIIAKEIK